MERDALPSGVRWRSAAALLAVALLLTLASIAVTTTRLEVQDWDCPPSPASCARPVLVGGFPLPFVSDYHGISVGGRVSLVGALLGEDLFHAGAFAVDLACWLILAGGIWWGRRRLRRSREPLTHH